MTELCQRCGEKKTTVNPLYSYSFFGIKLPFHFTCHNEFMDYARGLFGLIPDGYDGYYSPPESEKSRPIDEIFEVTKKLDAGEITRDTFNAIMGAIIDSYKVDECNHEHCTIAHVHVYTSSVETAILCSGWNGCPGCYPIVAYEGTDLDSTDTLAHTDS